MSFSVIRFPSQSSTQEMPFSYSTYSAVGNSDTATTADEHSVYTQQPHVQVNDTQMPNVFAQFTQAGHVAQVEDGRVELFIHFFRNDRYIGARYYLFDGTLMREDLFIKKLVCTKFVNLLNIY